MSSEDMTADFFERDLLLTTRSDPYKAPELVWEFDCRLVTMTPSGDPIAFGFARRENDAEWTPTGFGEREWRMGWTRMDRSDG